jgi:DNA primase
MTGPLDFGQVKKEADFEQILRHYGLKAFGAGTQRMVLCPFHKDTNPSCSVHLERNVFNCFGCGAHGSVLDFVALIENAPLQDAAARIAEICGLSDDRSLSYASRSKPHKIEREDDGEYRPLQPLPFRLTLDPSHPYLAKRGIGRELAAAFGLGYCSHGTMKGRICIPIHDEHGTLVAYAGRWASSEVPQGVPKYELPRGFEKHRVLFSLHRIAGAEHVAVVEGYWSVFRLHAFGLPTVALMGRTLSTQQETLLRDSGVRMLTLMLDGDEPGREATDQLLPRLSAHFFVHTIRLPDGMEPDTISDTFLSRVLL